MSSAECASCLVVLLRYINIYFLLLFGYVVNVANEKKFSSFMCKFLLHVKEHKRYKSSFLDSVHCQLNSLGLGYFWEKQSHREIFYSAVRFKYIIKGKIV